MSNSNTVKLVAKYYRAQEKRAGMELYQFVKFAGDKFQKQLATNLEKNASSSRSFEYLQSVLQQAKRNIEKAAFDIPEGIQKIKDISQNPAYAALLGGGAGGLLGAGIGMATGNNTLSKALQGGIAGATLGGGASLIGNSLSGRGDGYQDGINQLNSAISDAQEANQDTNWTARLMGLAGTSKAMNMADNFMARNVPSQTFLAQNMNTTRDRMDLINRLESWLQDGSSSRIGDEPVRDFVDLLQRTDKPDEINRLFRDLSSVVNQPKGVSLANQLLQNAGLSESSANIDAIMRAMQESRADGFQILPANLVDRLQNLTNWTSSALGKGNILPQGRLTGAVRGSKGLVSWDALRNANSALSNPFLRGRSGLYGAGLGLGLFGLGELMMGNNEKVDTSFDPEILERIRSKL
jgi:hypothetical protein